MLNSQKTYIACYIIVLYSLLTCSWGFNMLYSCFLVIYQVFGAIYQCYIAVWLALRSCYIVFFRRYNAIFYDIPRRKATQISHSTSELFAYCTNRTTSMEDTAQLLSAVTKSHARCRNLHGFLSVKVCLEVNWDSNSKQEMKSQCHSEMDGNQHWFCSWIFTTSIQWPKWIDSLVSPSLLARHTWNLRASLSQASKQRIRQESKHPVSGSPAHRHTQYPIAALTLSWQLILWLAWKFILHILREWQLSELSCINNKNSISDIFAY